VDALTAVLTPLGHTVSVAGRSEVASGQVDVHVVDAMGVQSLPGDGRFTYPPESVTGHVDGRPVPCISAAAQVMTHTGYEPRPVDHHDMALLASLGESVAPPFTGAALGAGAPFAVRCATSADVAAMCVVRGRSWHVAYRGLVPDAALASLDAGAAWAWMRLQVERASADAGARDVALVVGGDREVHGYLLASRADAYRTEDDETPVCPGADPGEIQLLYLDPTAWSAGAGLALLRAGEDALTAAGFDRLALWTLESNDRARRFYERNGWRADGTVKTVTHPHGWWREVRYLRDP
jgi:GNAT superfamily N-acetyltransferase